MTTSQASDRELDARGTSDRAGHQSPLVRTVEEYRSAYEARDVERMLALFADDAELTQAPGTFRGKEAIRRVLEWDARLSPTATVRDAGVGLVVHGQTAVWEQVVSLTYEGIPYEERALTVAEFDDELRITRMRSYYDKLALMHEIASQYPGIRGRLFRRLTGFLVGLGAKGLDVSPS